VSRKWRTAVAVAVIVLLALLWWRLPVGRWSGSLADGLRRRGAAGVALFLAVSSVAEIAMVPGSWLTLAAGFAYGPFRGLLVALTASVLGSTAAFLLARTVLREWVTPAQERSVKLRALNNAVSRNGFRLILLLRLSPLIPFNVLNYALGLSDVSLGRYVLASTIGMIPATLMYAYLGSLATAATSLAEAGAHHGRQQVALAIAGLAATVGAVVVVARAARRALEAELGR
jgi:uncharacterized membrane protein YdjX (TVP38/TMEM64 family)